MGSGFIFPHEEPPPLGKSLTGISESALGFWGPCGRQKSVRSKPMSKPSFPHLPAARPVACGPQLGHAICFLVLMFQHHSVEEKGLDFLLLPLLGPDASGAVGCEENGTWKNALFT